MVKDILNILTDNLTNERLDNIVQQNNNYKEVMKRVNSALLDLEKMDSNTKDMQDIIEKYDSVVHEESALYARLAYQQGMKDLAKFMLSLI